jgi:L-serine dehydratase
MLRLICDPIAIRVEAPCLGKDVVAAGNALACANMARAGYGPVIPLDEVIATAEQVASQMARELCCTALGGLSVTPTSKAIEKQAGQESCCLRRLYRQAAIRTLTPRLGPVHFGT